jgi:hypothetical protein
MSDINIQNRMSSEIFFRPMCHFQDIECKVRTARN